MEPQGIRLTIHHDGDATTFVRVLATVVNPTAVYLASTWRVSASAARCTLMVRDRRRVVEQCLIDDVVARIGGRYCYDDVELVTLTGSPVEMRPAVDTAA